MFFSYEFIKHAYSGLKNLDPTEGKSRQEKVSGLRYLIATSELMHRHQVVSFHLGVGSLLRPEFITAVGNVVALNDQGLFSKDFFNEFDVNSDYGVTSNFLTTRLANSRSQDINYPGRPGGLLFLTQEHVSILTNIAATLSQSYGINHIKAELCVWLLRNKEINAATEALSSKEIRAFIRLELDKIYTPELMDAIFPNEDEFQTFLTSAPTNIFSSERSDFSTIADVVEGAVEEPIALTARVLLNDLPDDDKIYNTVKQLLTRGAKGILFSGPPGTSKTWYALKVALKIIDGDQAKLERVQFHPSFTYEDFIEGLVSTGSISGTDPLFKPKDKVFLNLCEKARNDRDNLHILIIDEFSRGDPSKIFGELLTYIEPDYREINFRLPYSEKEISIPQNVVIFATMNPYDKSVVDLDSAMERRFDVIELLPNVATLRSFLEASEISGENIGKIVEFFNSVNNLSPHGFGHTYFKDLKEEHDFILLWNHKLKFILEKMFRFKDDAYKEVRAKFEGIISDANKDKIA